ncbi:fungal-specific transcription factor domain-containing protein [Aspergillus cavernicola]|uniref:Fungal-specific transcription factor domain-containing protein n=1 Tax=Aspergillus cavernicola TaxID=176166 RepID=A0ABR4J0J4_9EURO
MAPPDEVAATQALGPEKQVASEAIDEAARYLAHHSGHAPLSPEEERSMMRKMDWILLPMLFMTATLGAVDKVAISTAAIYGLETDLHLVGQQYSWCGSILSLGVSIIVPSISLIIAGFYKKSEQPPRNALVFAAASSIFNGFLSWAVGHIPSSAPLAVWQYLFLLTGSVSTLWSIFAFIYLPDSPMNAFFLTEREKYHAVQRLAENKTGITNRQWKWDQALEAVIDPKTWILFFFNIAINIPNGGLTTFSGIIINNLGFSAVDTSLLNMPTGVMSTLSAFVFSWIAAKWANRRCLVTMLASCVPAIGAIIVYTLPRTNIGGQMVGIYLLYTYFGPYIVGISMSQANTAGSTKKTVQYSVLYIGYAVGNLIGPQTFRANQAPAYTGGFAAMLACYCVCVLLMAVYWVLTVMLNRRVTEGVEGSVEGQMDDEDLVDAFADKTDFQQKGKQETRRRTGCFQCKEKHIQCTEEHPRCRRCEIHNLECVRGLRLIFREDAIQRGIKFGREGVWTKRSGPRAQGRKKAVFEGVPLNSYINRWVFLNLTLDDFPEEIKSQTRSSTQPQPQTHLPLTAFPPSSAYHPLHTFPYTDGYLLDYFITGISPSCSLSASHNPYISLVIPLCFVSVTLRNALLAVAANQLCLLGHSQFTKQACHYKQKALQGLRQEISTGFPDEGTVAAVLMLCFQDISDGCSPSWITHLRGGLQLIDCNTHQTSPSLWNFFRMYFVAHDIMSRTASDDFQKDEPLQLWSETDDLDEIDVVMGCSRGLMTLINRISILASTRAKILKDRRLTTAEITDHAATTSDLCNALLSLKQTLPAHSIDRGDLERVAHVKQLAALLYLNERLGSVSVSASVSVNHARGPSSRHSQNPPTTETEANTLNLSISPAPSKPHLISSIISTISTLPNMATLLWPLFVLGNVGLENEEQRRFVLDRLSGIQRSRNLGSVWRTIEAVKHSFGTRDLQLDLDLGLGSAKGRSWGHESYRFISLA